MFKIRPGITSFKRDNFLKNFSESVFILAVFLVILIAITSFYQFNKLIKTNAWVTHTYEVILNATTSIYFYNYLEAKQREYILFDDEEALQNFNLNIGKLKSSLDQLIYLTKDNPEQQKKSRDYRLMIDERIILFNQAISLKQAGKYTLAERNKIFSRGKVLSYEINDIIENIITHEKFLLQERDSKLLNEINAVNFIVIFGEILSTLFLLIAFFVSRYQLHYRLEMEKSAKDLARQLNSIIEGANDMIVALNNNYQFLIYNESYRSEFKKLFGKEVEIGKSLMDILADFPEIKNKLLNTWRKSLSGDNSIQSLQFPLDGVMNTYELTPSLIKAEDGTILGAVHIIRNVTERIKEQTQLQISYDELNLATEELKNKNDKITLLLEMSDILLVTNSIDELNAVVPNYCNKILNFSSGNFYIMRPSKDLLEITGHWGNPSSRTEIFTHDQCWALRLGRVHHSTLKNNDLLCGHVQAREGQNIEYMCLPLRAQNEVFGVLYVEYSFTENKHLSDAEKLLINAFAEVMALALSNVRLRDNLRYQSIRDPLTSLYNRRYLEEFLSNQLLLAQRENIPITILMMDLDHFKRINDIHGHDAGDIVLKEFSRLLLEFVRRSDFATRFGGEEFVVVLFNSDQSGGRKRAEEIREALSHLHIKYGNQNIHLTVSIGMSSFPEHFTDGKTLIELADKALYFAKKTGRNKVVSFEEIAEKIENT